MNGVLQSVDVVMVSPSPSDASDLQLCVCAKTVLAGHTRQLMACGLCFHFLGLRNNAPVNIVQMFVWTCFYFS